MNHASQNLLSVNREKVLTVNVSSLRAFIYLLLMFFSVVRLAKTQDVNACHERVLVSVVDHEGGVVSGLGALAFRAELRGRPLKAVVTTPTSAPRRVVIVVDFSGSTTGLSKIARALVQNFVASAQPLNLRLALVLFSDHVIKNVDFSRPPEEVLHELDQLPHTEGPTALFDALNYAVGLFGEPLTGDSIYLISDGGENASWARRTDVEREFLAKGIRIYTFCLKTQYFWGAEQTRPGLEVLKGLSDLSGGEALALDPELDFSKSGQERLGSKLQKLYQQMADFYELQLDIPSELLRDGQQWNLEVVDGKGRKRKDVHVTYPRKLLRCSESREATGLR